MVRHIHLPNDDSEPVNGNSKERIINEKEIIEASKKDPVCFKPIYEFYHHAIINFVNYKVNDINTASEITSNVFYKALMKISAYTNKGVPFSSWLYKIAYNETMMFFRNSKKQRHVVIDNDLTSKIADAIEESNSDELKRAVAETLKTLNKEELELIELKYFEQKSINEIAFILNLKPGNVKVRTHRIIKKIRILIKENYGEI